MLPRFSIIIPVYNIAPYLHECFDSILTQTFTDWEAICVDDGSTDGGGDILDEYAAKDPRFRVFHQPNAGVSAARNLGLDVATGDWIYFVDGDDALATDVLEVYSKLIMGYPSVDAFFFPGVMPFVPGVQMLTMRGEGGVQVFSQNPTKGTGLLGNDGVNGHPYLRLLRCSKFRGVLFPVGVSMMEDSLNLVSVLAIPAIWARADIRGYLYRTRDNSATHLKTQKRCEEVLNVFRRMLVGAVNELGCDASDLRRFWHRSAGVMEFYLTSAFGGEDRATAERCAKMGMEIEKDSHLRILGWFSRMKARVVIWQGNSSALYKIVCIAEWLFNGISSRLKRWMR